MTESKTQKVVTEEQKAECRALKAIYIAKKKDLGLSQQKIADDLDVSQGAVGHYLNGRNALNVRSALIFARILEVEVSAFSKRLAREISGIKTKKQQELLAIAKSLPPEAVDLLIQNGKGLALVMGTKKETPSED